MTAALKGNADGSGAIQVGGLDAITISTSQIVSFSNPIGTLSLTNPTITGGLTMSSGSITMAAGTTALAPLVFTTGSLLTSPVAGTIEYDGSTWFSTDDVTDGRGFIPSTHFFRLTADAGAAIGPGIANFFGTTSGISLDPSIFYEVEYTIYFLKTTAAGVVFTLTFSNAPINNNAYYVGTPVGGVGTVGTSQTAALVKSAATGGALPITGSLTTAVNHQYKINAMFQANATTGGTLNLQITSGSGTVTPLTGSYYKITRIPSANTGAFV
jgi:hypothetical protein